MPRPALILGLIATLVGSVMISGLPSAANAGKTLLSGRSGEITVDGVERQHFLEARDKSMGTTRLLNALPSRRNALEQINVCSPTIATTCASPRTLGPEASDTINVADVGLEAAFSSANAGKKITVPPGIWKTSSTLIVPDGSIVEFLGRGAVIAYNGPGHALQVKNSKNVRINSPVIDITSAGPDAEAIHIMGCWHCGVFYPRIELNGINQAGIALETSFHSGQGWGTYMFDIFNPQIVGTGRYGIRTYQTSGDTRRYVTHLNIYAGWAKGVTYGLHLRQTSSLRIQGWVHDSGIDAINIDNSDNIYLSPGELGPNSGFGINLGSKLSNVYLVAPSHAGTGGSLGYMNTSAFAPSSLDNNKLRLHSPDGDPDYFVEIGVNKQFNSTSVYISGQGGSRLSPPPQFFGYTQNKPVGTGMMQYGDPRRKSETLLGRNNTAVTDTTGFVQLPSSPGTPALAPTSAQAGYVPVIIDNIDGKLCAYVNSAWKCAILK